MSDIKNLVYNGDGSFGTSGWSSGTTVSDGVITKTGNLYNGVLIPVAAGNTYKLSFDFICTKNDGSNYFYIALQPYDSYQNFIGINMVQKSMSSTETTLASALNKGDTTVTLTSGTNWYNSSTQYRKLIGICDNLAWGYNRSSYNQYYSSISSNTLTLSSAWAGSNYAAGTKVANFTDGGTYYYPISWSNANIPSTWTSASTTFTGGDNVRFSTCYVYFSTLGYSHTYSMRNIRIENITNYQICDKNSGVTSPNLLSTGIINTTALSETGQNIRYIKDYINGSTANTANHWVEIKAFDEAGNNLAYNKNVLVSGSSSWVKNYITDGVTTTSPYIGTDNSYHYVIVDLGFEVNIKKIQVWHYYGDSRTYYDHSISVSTDNSNWTTYNIPSHAENSSGYTLNLYPKKLSLYSTSLIEANSLIEY